MSEKYWPNDGGSIEERMTPERLEEIKNNSMGLCDRGISYDLDEVFAALEEAWAEVERLRGGKPDVIVTWGTGETTGVNDPMRLRAEQAEADRDKWMGQFDEAEHRGLAYMEERDKLAARVKLLEEER